MPFHHHFRCEPTPPACGALSRWQRTRARAATALAALTCVMACGAARAELFGPDDRIRIAYTPKVFHVTSDDDFVDWNHIVALEWITPRHAFWGADRTHFGLSLFDNSYGQFSQSIYAGLEWDWTQALGGDVFVSLSLGLVNGYDEPYEDKLPLNEALGVGLTLVPAIGWQRGNLGFAASLSGSAIGFRISYTFDR